MPSPTYKYVWVLTGASIDGVKVYGKKEMLEQKLSNDGADPIRKTEVGTNCWQYEVRGKRFKAVKQKIEDSHGLAVT